MIKNLCDFPFPYLSMVALSNDCEFMDFKCYVDIYRLLCGPKGLGLESSTSMFFYTTHALCHSSFGYFSDLSGTQSTYAPVLREIINAGYIDTIHAYGDFDEGGFERSMAEKVLEESSKHNFKIPIWTGHGSDKNLQNLGHEKLHGYQCGDDPSSPAYHLDLLRGIGAEYFWVDDGYVTIPGDETPILYSEKARDGTMLKLFRRYRGLFGKPAPMASTLSEQITLQALNELVQRKGVCIIYQHLGAWCKTPDNKFIKNVPPYFSEEGFKILFFLSKLQKEKKTLVTTNSRLLRYLDIRDSLHYECRDNIIYIKSLKTGFLPEHYEGISFVVAPENMYKVVLIDSHGREYLMKTENHYNHDGNHIVSLPWQKLGDFIW